MCYVESVIGGDGKRKWEEMSLVRLIHTFPHRSFNRELEFYFKCMRKSLKVFKLQSNIHVKESLWLLHRKWTGR